jgi:hypothetical protein
MVVESLTYRTTPLKEKNPMAKLLVAGLALSLLAPAAAFAQNGGAVTGGAAGAATGAVVGGPVGAVVGGVTGAIAGGIADQNTPRFREYVVQQNVPSYAYREDVRVGAVLPSNGVTYYEVPSEYGATEYRYTVVNNTPVLVEPRSHKIIQVIR